MMKAIRREIVMLWPWAAVWRASVHCEQDERLWRILDRSAKGSET